MVSKKMAFGAGTLVLLLALLVGAFWAYTMMGAAGGSAGSWNDYRAADALLAGSGEVVLATYLDEESHEIPTVTTDGGVVVGSVTETYQRFRVVESWKGDAVVGQDLYVVTSAGYKTALAEGGSETYEYDSISLTAGEDYVMFLHGRSRPDGYPAQYGDIIWTRPGEPAVAEVDDAGRLTFIATARYKDTVDGEGMERVPGSDAPFEMTKEDIKGSTPAK